MSFREKHLWISIVASVGVWGWYFWFLIRHVVAGRLVNDHFTGDVSLAFMGCLVLVVLIDAVPALCCDGKAVKAVAGVLYFWFPNGQGVSEIFKKATPKMLGIGTGRNWNTVLKLGEMVGA